ncbi:MAG TPA: histidine kinase [Clostridia bacterium]
MFYTANLVNKSIIFICCFIVCILEKSISSSVTVVLISLIFSGFLSYFDSGEIRIALTAGFSILSFFIPELVIFLPLIAYDMFFNKYQYINLIAAIPLLNSFKYYPAHIFAVIVITMILSIMLKYWTEEQHKLITKHNELIDSAREMSLQLKKQNQDIMEKQDYELNLATVNERNRIAREIHDNVGHLLSSAILQSGALLTVTEDEKNRESLKSLNNTLNEAMNSIHSSVHMLYDDSVDLNNQMWNIIKKFTFCKINYNYNITGNPGKKIKYAIISIVKEALSNIMKHSDATQASITLNEHPGLYQLIIRDNGTVKKDRLEEGLGLKNMEERVNSLNGIINIIRKNGFEIFISVPKPERNE